MSLYSPRHQELIRSYKKTYEVLQANYDCKLPPSLKAIADHEYALLNLRTYLDSIGVKMPFPKFKRPCDVDDV